MTFCNPSLTFLLPWLSNQQTPLHFIQMILYWCGVINAVWQDIWFDECVGEAQVWSFLKNLGGDTSSRCRITVLNVYLICLFYGILTYFSYNNNLHIIYSKIIMNISCRFITILRSTDLQSTVTNPLEMLFNVPLVHFTLNTYLKVKISHWMAKSHCCTFSINMIPFYLLGISYRCSKLKTEKIIWSYNCHLYRCQ